MKTLLARLDAMSAKRAALLGLVCASVMELITVVMRYGLRLESTRDTALLGRLTFGIRIHHGYVGLVMLLVCLRLAQGRWRNALIIVGLGLVVSDLVHHFLVLWPIEGSPEFHLVYPDPPG